ncbi:unnamed protein product [Allacma fusca]|uniref:Uncharacterized protein n=1 Tax=Allacma fusca TaxID=39272 RepID=A0A8J2J3V7_9HEXA|nr:unnamed protein product [Allacma fusca]
MDLKPWLKTFSKIVAIGLIWGFVVLPCQSQDDGMTMTSDLMTTTEPETTTQELRCHIALGTWIPKLMEDANMCVSDNPSSYDRMKLRNYSIPLPPINCIMRCIGMRIGFFKEDGSVDEPEIIDFIEQNVIPQYKELAFDILANCAEYTSALRDTLTDPNCIAHGKVFKCFADQSHKVVKQCAMRLGIHRDSPPQPMINQG